tara:strand:+ start:5489 stop:6739 length:1251 start_codon:yes stop_codon:yes gene_type:complete
MFKDKALAELNEAEKQRQESSLSLIASENIMSKEVQKALSTHFANKTVEGYPGKRYHAGCEYADKLENLAISRAKNLFNSQFVNVQAHSCSQANLAALMSCIPLGGKILSMRLEHGGHLSHGFKGSITGRIYKVYNYGVSTPKMTIDYKDVQSLANKYQPDVIFVGSSSYPREFDYSKFKNIADSVGAKLIADVAHVSGLIAASVINSPVGYADIITSSTYKTLRGPRGGIILSENEELALQIDRNIFPGLQGTPCLASIAAKAVCLGEAAEDSFKDYSNRTVSFAKQFSENLISSGLEVLTKGTDTHMVLINVSNLGLTGKSVSNALESCGILCNMNLLPFDKNPPSSCSGIRFGFSSSAALPLSENEIDSISETVITVIREVQRKGSISEDLKNKTHSYITSIMTKKRFMSTYK